MMIVDAPSQTQGDPLTAPGAGDSMQQCLIRFNARRVIELTRDYFNRPLPQKLLLDGLRNDE
jgi:hypothetical protein